MSENRHVARRLREAGYNPGEFIADHREPEKFPVAVKAQTDASYEDRIAAVFRSSRNSLLYGIAVSVSVMLHPMIAYIIAALPFVWWVFISAIGAFRDVDSEKRTLAQEAAAGALMPWVVGFMVGPFIAFAVIAAVAAVAGVAVVIARHKQNRKEEKANEDRIEVEWRQHKYKEEQRRRARAIAAVRLGSRLCGS